jgi:hypothetical protein
MSEKYLLTISCLPALCFPVSDEQNPKYYQDPGRLKKWEPGNLDIFIDFPSFPSFYRLLQGASSMGFPTSPE